MNGFYWIYLIVFGLFIGEIISKKPERNTLLYYIACGTLILFFVIQDASVSSDTREYMLQYSLMRYMRIEPMLHHKFEVGYNLLCKLVGALFTGERAMFVAMALLILVPFFIWFRRESGEPMMALMSFLALGMYYNAIVFWRQFCAMAIMTFAWRYVRERKLLPFLGLLLLAVSFHKSAVLLAAVYIAYAVPVRKWLIPVCAVCSVLLGVLGKPIMVLVYKLIYTNYRADEYFYGMGGYNMFFALWAFVLVTYWLMRERLEEPKIKLLFMMTLIAATIQPVAFSYFFWCRIVLYFRVAMVMLLPELYTAVFCQKENNKLLNLLEAHTPKLYSGVMRLYDKRWFQCTVQIAMFAVLFVWYVTELDGAVYVMAPV